MKIIHIFRIVLGLSMIVSSLAETSTESLLKLSVACQNANFDSSRGQWQRKIFKNHIKVVDDAMAALVESGYLVETKVLMRSAEQMNDEEKRIYGEIKLTFAHKLSSKYGFYTATEMMGWEFRDQIEGGRFYRDNRDPTKDYILRIRLPAKYMKEYRDLIKDFVVKELAEIKN